MNDHQFTESSPKVNRLCPSAAELNVPPPYGNDGDLSRIHVIRPETDEEWQRLVAFKRRYGSGALLRLLAGDGPPCEADEPLDEPAPDDLSLEGLASLLVGVRR